MTALEREPLDPGGWIALARGLVPSDAALMAELVASLPLHVETLRIMGREVLTPRLTSWHGDPDAVYRYSGRAFTPQPWTEPLLDLQRLLATVVGVRFNSLLVNYYRDGRDSMGFHSDDERELGPSAPHDVLIASVSLGARRSFVMKRRADGEKRTFDLGGGDLLVMGGAVQAHWVHGIPKTARPVGPRMNLTFRVVRAS